MEIPAGKAQAELKAIPERKALKLSLFPPSQKGLKNLKAIQIFLL